ncbi:MAG: Mur ligase family protein [Hyphomicrobiaceae bacterium]
MSDKLTPHSPAFDRSLGVLSDQDEIGDGTEPLNNHQKLREYIRYCRSMLARRRSRATFVGVTGSSGKTTCAELVASILSSQGTVINPPEDNTVRPIGRAIRLGQSTSNFAVFEAGIGPVSRMEPMARLIQPHVAIVTMIGLEHYKTFRSKEIIATEKGALIEAIRSGGFAVLNADDEHVMSMATRTNQRIVTFGQSSAADYRVVSATAAYPQCLELVVNCRGREVRFNTRLPAAHFWVSCAGAIAAASELGVPTEAIQERVARYEGKPLRFQPLVTSGPTFILDTMKAPVGTLPAAFSAFAACKFPYKRIVLGALAHYGGSDRPKYRDAYRAARAIADQVIVVDRHLHRYDEVVEDLASGKLLELATPKLVDEHIRRTFRRDELILLKGSENLHLERIALSWTRDVRCWEPKCRRLDETCVECSLIDYPFEQHRQVIDARKQRNRSGVRLLGR